MAVTTTKTNKPINPRGNDQSPKGYNRAEIYSGKALDFDGSNDKLSLDGFTMSGDTATLSFHLKADDWDANSFIFAAGTPEIVIGSTTGGNNLSFYDSSSWKTFGAISDTTSTNFFSIVFSGTSAIAYMNGVKFGNTLTITPINISSVTGVKLMSKYTGDAFFFNGQLSGFKIYNTALTAAQVADLYNNPEKVVPTGVDNSALKLWLPMQEGAGTTAYDGSGNGNHGTISGATYVHGVGAPVAQTAVIDWNKGTNLVPDVNNFNSAFEVTTTTGLADDPAGRSNAVRFTKTTDTTPRYGFQTCGSATLSGNTDYVISLFYKYDGHAFTSSIEYNNSGHFDLSWVCNLNIAESGVTIASNANCTGKVVAYSNDWYRVDVELTTGASPSGNPQYLVKIQGDTGTSLLVAYAQLEQASSVGPLVPTFGSAQNSPVLLPQGLTAGRDITGVNLFENVRKQGALNLDGNSWAEVHDNASVDVSEITAEGWMYAESVTSANNRIINKWDSGYPERSFQLYGQNNTINWMLSDGSAAYSITGGTLTQGEWYHVVGTYDGTTQKIYLNGVQVASTALSITLKQSSFKVMLGGYTTGLYSLNPIAQPRIYNRALTAEEVQRNYDAGKNIYTN